MAREIRPVMDRLMEKVREDENGCWIFEGYVNSDGYGQISLDGRLRSTHRVSYEHFVGPIGPGEVIDHLCFSPACVNPDHLRAITPKQNQEHRRGASKNSTTGVRGVYLRMGLPKPWMVQVKHNGKLHYGGYYATLEEAEAAAIKLRAELYTHDDYLEWEESRKELVND